jgi:short-subunit dehydrogenase
LATVAGECQARGGTAIAIVTDVSEQAQCSELIQRTMDQYDRIDMLVNNAGITMWANFEDVSDISFFEQMMRVNYLGSVYCTYYALPFLKKTRGQIVGISSLAGRNGIPKRSGYAASKHAMVGFFDTLRIEIAEYGVSVTMIYPDFVATETRKRAFGADGKPIGKSSVREDEVMSAERCAKLIIRAAAARKRELIMTWRGKMGLWVKLIAPGVVDRVAKKEIIEGR